MSSYGITAAGFNRKRLDVLLDELNTELRTVFGDNFDLAPEAPGGQISGIVSGSNADLWELAEGAYNAFNPSAASGAALSNLVQLNGLTRKIDSASIVELTLSGTNGTLIPAGSLVSTADKAVTFATRNAVTIVGGTATVTADATAVGPLVALAGTVTVIDTPITGWATVTNAADAIPGAFTETDTELRARRAASVARDAVAVVDSIRAEILAVSGVTQSTVLENATNATVDGLPAHNIHAIVVGGDDTEIATAIYLKKTAGTPSFGSTTVNIPDSEGMLNPIKFSRPTLIPIYVEVNLTTFADYPADGDDQIKQAIVDYANGDLVQGRGFSLGDDVIWSELYTPVNTIPGHQVDSLFIKLSAPADETNNIAIAVDEIADFQIANIVVNS